MLDALIMAGGRGSRFKIGLEKPLLTVLGIPMIVRVINAVLSSRVVDRIVVSVSSNTPHTLSLIKSIGDIEVFVSSGKGYVEDVSETIEELDLRDVLVIPADMPLLSGEVLRLIADEFAAREVDSLVVSMSVSKAKSIGLRPEYIDGDVVIAGLNVIRREAINRESNIQSYLNLDKYAYNLINVNSLDEYVIAFKEALSRIFSNKVELANLNELDYYSTIEKSCIEITLKYINHVGTYYGPLPILDKYGKVVSNSDVIKVFRRAGLLIVPAIIIEDEEVLYSELEKLSNVRVSIPIGEILLLQKALLDYPDL